MARLSAYASFLQQGFRHALRWAALWIGLSLLCLIASGGCKRGDERNKIVEPLAKSDSDRPSSLADDNNHEASKSYRFLTLGNSHSIAGGPFTHLEEMISERDPQRRATGKSWNAAFLDQFSDLEQLTRSATEWNPQFVSLQGQKISSSGKYFYSTREAESIAKTLANEGITVLLFAEWGRIGNSEETHRIQKTYEEICVHAKDASNGYGTIEVVPVGIVWERVLGAHSTVALHDRDGNHSNALGAIVTSIAFYTWIFNEIPRSFPGDQEQIAFLQKVARIAMEVRNEYKPDRSADHL